jgi:hypothetical protein
VSVGMPPSPLRKVQLPPGPRLTALTFSCAWRVRHREASSWRCSFDFLGISLSDRVTQKRPPALAPAVYAGADQGFLFHTPLGVHCRHKENPRVPGGE